MNRYGCAIRINYYLELAQGNCQPGWARFRCKMHRSGDLRLKGSLDPKRTARALVLTLNLGAVTASGAKLPNS